MMWMFIYIHMDMDMDMDMDGWIHDITIPMHNIHTRSFRYSKSHLHLDLHLHIHIQIQIHIYIYIYTQQTSISSIDAASTNFHIQPSQPSINTKAKTNKDPILHRTVYRYIMIYHIAIKKIITHLRLKQMKKTKLRSPPPFSTIPTLQ